MTPTTLQCAGRPAPAATSVAVRICVSAIGRLVRLAQLSLGAPLPAGAAAAAETIAAHAVVASRLVRPTPRRRQPARISMSPSQNRRAARPYLRPLRRLGRRGSVDPNVQP